MFESSAAIWALTDDRAGHNAHTLGLAKALGLEFEEKRLQFNRLAALPPSLLAERLISLDAKSRAALCAPWPSIVIASGRRMVPVMKAIKRASPKTKLVQCLWPGQESPFDVIVAPSHDKVPPSAHIVRYHGALHHLDAQALKDAAITFHALFEPLPKPILGVLIGGHSKKAKATLDDLHHLIDTAEFLAGDGSLMLSTSRRTPKGYGDAIRERLTCPYYLHEWGSGAPNPYYAMLARCDALIVSGDSVSMIAECCSTGKPVLIDDGFHSMRDKHHRAAQHLFAAGHAAPLRADCNWKELTPAPLNEMSRVAGEVKALLHI